jgi:hypothetical protein
MAFWPPEPTPRDVASGSTPMMNAIEVMRNHALVPGDPRQLEPDTLRWPRDVGLHDLHRITSRSSGFNRKGTSACRYTFFTRPWAVHLLLDDLVHCVFDRLRRRHRGVLARLSPRQRRVMAEGRSLEPNSPTTLCSLT